jgi:hypothetical protein
MRVFNFVNVYNKSELWILITDCLSIQYKPILAEQYGYRLTVNSSLWI